MKTIHKKTIGCMLGLVLFAQLPVIGQNVQITGFVGQWTNKDFKTRGVTRVYVRRDGDKVIVHEWGRCQPTECDWGDAIATLKGSAMSVTWNQGFAIKTQELTMLAGGSLQVTTHNHFTHNDGRQDYDIKDIFVMGLVHDWSDQTPK